MRRRADQAEGMLLVSENRLIATEEHTNAAHEREVLPSDRIEVELMRTVENTDVWRSALVDLDARMP